MTTTNENKEGYKQTPLGWIPQDWNIILLIELAQNGISNGVFTDPKKVGKGYRLINVVDLYNEPKIDTTKLARLEISKEEFKNNKVLCGDLLFTRSSLKLEGIAHCNINLEDADDITYDGHIMKISPKADVVYPTFLRLYCISNSARKFFMSHAKQTTMTTIGQDDISELFVPVPPLPEQKAIASILSTWDKAIEKVQQLIDQKELRKKALMQQILMGKKRLPGFTEQWKKLSISDIAEEVTLRNAIHDQFVVLSCTKYDGLVPSLEYFGRKIFSSDLSTYKVVPKNTFAYATNHIEEGSIGYQRAYENALISPMYTVFRTNAGIDDEFLFRILKSHNCVHEYQKRMEGSIDRRGGLRWDEFSKIKLLLPQKKEQIAINELLITADKELELLSQKLELLKEQKRGLMQKLLTGQIRIKT